MFLTPSTLIFFQIFFTSWSTEILIESNFWLEVSVEDPQIAFFYCHFFAKNNSLQIDNDFRNNKIML